MLEPPDVKEPEIGPKQAFTYDFAQAERILQAMDFLRQEAVSTHIPEIMTMVDASYRLLVTAYYCVLRHKQENGKLSKPPDLKELDICAAEKHAYDYTRAQQVLSAMDFLRKEAVNTGIPEIVTMVDAPFQLLLTAYYCIRRYEMTELAGTDIH